MHLMYLRILVADCRVQRGTQSTYVIWFNHIISIATPTYQYTFSLSDRPNAYDIVWTWSIVVLVELSVHLFVLLNFVNECQMLSSYKPSLTCRSFKVSKHIEWCKLFEKSALLCIRFCSSIPLYRGHFQLDHYFRSPQFATWINTKEVKWISK